MLSIATCLFTIFTSTYASPITASTAASTQGTAISSISYNGTACPPNSASYIFSPARDIITIAFERAQVQTRTNLNITGSPAATCDLTVLLDSGSPIRVPSDTTALQATVRGYHLLDSYIISQVKTRFQFADLPPWDGQGTDVYGPISRADWVQKQVVQVPWMAFSAGQKEIKVRLDLNLDQARNPRGNAVLAVGSLEIAFV